MKSLSNSSLISWWERSFVSTIATWLISIAAAPSVAWNRKIYIESRCCLAIGNTKSITLEKIQWIKVTIGINLGWIILGTYVHSTGPIVKLNTSISEIIEPTIKQLLALPYGKVDPIERRRLNIMQANIPIWISFLFPMFDKAFRVIRTLATFIKIIVIWTYFAVVDPIISLSIGLQ